MKVKRFSCEDVGELTPRYLDDALDAATRQDFDRHLTACASCAEYLTELRATVTALAGLPAPALSSRVRSRLLAAFRASRNP